MLHRGHGVKKWRIGHNELREEYGRPGPEDEANYGEWRGVSLIMFVGEVLRLRPPRADFAQDDKRGCAALEMAGRGFRGVSGCFVCIGSAFYHLRIGLVSYSLVRGLIILLLRPFGNSLQRLAIKNVYISGLGRFFTGRFEGGAKVFGRNDTKRYVYERYLPEIVFGHRVFDMPAGEVL